MLQSLQTTWKNLTVGSPEVRGQAWLRVLVGGFFIWQGQSAMDNLQGLQLTRQQLLAWAAHHPLPWVQGFILKGLVPNLHWLANALTDTLVLMGLSWITGFGVGLSSLILLGASGVILLLAQPLQPGMIWICGLMACVGLSLYKGSGQLQGLFGKQWRFPLVRLNGPKVAHKSASHKSSKQNRHETRASKTRRQESPSFNLASTPQPQQSASVKSLKPKPVSLSVVPSKRPESKARAGKVRRLEKVLKRQAKRFETKSNDLAPLHAVKPVALRSAETKQDKPSSERIKPQPQADERDATQEVAPVAEELKVVKIFDHRTADDDD